MNAFGLSGLFIGITSTAIAILVFVKNRRSRTNQLWIAFNLCVAIWGFGGMKIAMAREPVSALHYWRLTYVGIIFIPVLFLHFVYSLLRIRKHIHVLLAYATGLFFLSMCFSDRFISHVSLMFGSLYYMGHPPTPLYISFTVLWMATIIYTHILLIRAMRRSDGVERNRIKYVIYATLIGFSGGITTFFPKYGINLYPYGNFTVMLYPLITTYAILAYRLMDITIVIKKTMAYSLSAGLLTGLFIVFPVVLSKPLSSLAGVGGMTASVISAVAVGLLFAPVKNKIQHLIDRVFYKTTYDYYATLQRVGQELATKIELKEIQQYLIDSICSIFNLRSAFLLYAREGRTYRRHHGGRGASGRRTGGQAAQHG